MYTAMKEVEIKMKLSLQRDVVEVEHMQVLTESSVEPVTQAKHAPIKLVCLIMNIIVVPFRVHVDKQHEECINQSYYRQKDIC